MKKNRLICLGIIVTLMSGLVACGNTTATSNSDNKVDAGALLEGQTPQENTTKEEAASKQEVSQSEEMARYESFLRDEESVFFDKCIENCEKMDFLCFSGINKEETKGKPFKFSELVEFIAKAQTDSYWADMKPSNISYAYLDCGMDGKKELAIYLEGMGEALDYTNIYVISLIDDKLQIVFADSYGYRTFGSVNENGYYNKGGSGGAALHISDYYYINEKGDVILDYTSSQYASTSSLYIPDNEELEIAAYEQGVNEKIIIEEYSFDYTKSNEDYIDYLKRCTWTYYATDDNYNEIVSEEYYKDGNPYKIFWDSTGMPLSKPEEVNAKIREHRKNAGIPEAVVEGNEVEINTFSGEMLHYLLNFNVSEPEYMGEDEHETFIMENPSTEYFYNGSEDVMSTMVNVVEKSSKANEIIDTDEWFSNNNLVKPDNSNFSDSNYYYYKESDTILNIYNLNGNQLYALDFTNYYNSDSYLKGNSFTAERIGYAQSVENVLYVSTFHWTYAESEPKNAYITAFDMNNNFNVIWKSEPLTCNSNNFEIVDNTIICGYGFTDEDDYLYILDRSTGKRNHSIKLKSAPEYIIKKDNELYVRTYNTDYVFEIVY